MDIALIEKLMAMLSKSDLTELEVTEGNLHVRLSKGPAGSPAVDTAPVFPAGDMAPVMDAPAGTHSIRAGTSGTFYCAPSPGAMPFVTEGQRIAEGQTLGLIEAMKMLNPVEAESSGTLCAILVNDGDPVSPGQVLFQIARA